MRSPAKICVLLTLVGLCLFTACGGGGGNGGSVRPVSGAFQKGGAEQEFNVILVVVEDGGDRVDSVQLLCTGSFPVTIGSDIPIEGGRFQTKSKDVRLEGQFVSRVRAEGTISALTEAARGCGVPDQGTWAAVCNLAVEKTDGGFQTSKPTSGPCAQQGSETGD